VKHFIRLVQGKGFVSRLIEFRTSSDWPTHVELVATTDDDVPSYGVLSSRYPRGVQYRGYSDYPIQRDRWYKVILPSDACERAWKAMETIIGQKYDVRDIIGCKYGIALNEDWHTDHRWICSEAVAWAFEKAGTPLFNPAEPVARITPRDFLLSTLLSLAKVIK
jgi:hypothetical protein